MAVYWPEKSCKGTTNVLIYRILSCYMFVLENKTNYQFKSSSYEIKSNTFRSRYIWSKFLCNFNF